MPVTTSYPGIYLEELLSNAHSVVAAPTSVAVFVGYAHPFKTAASTFGKPIRIGSFSEYERWFGGLYVSAALDSNLAHAVNQFFLNGGSDAYVVGLQASYHLSGGGASTVDAAETTLGTTGGGLVFTAREPTDHPKMGLAVTISNIRASAGAALDLADYTVTYGSRVETHRGVPLSASGFGGLNTASSLIDIQPDTAYGTAFTSNARVELLLSTAPPANLVGTFHGEDFTDVFQADTALDKVEVFNLLLVPGVSDTTVLSAALAFAERKLAFVIMDPPPNAGADQDPLVPANDIDAVMTGGSIPKSTNGALFFPYLKTQNPLTGEPLALPPGGFVAGVFARTDTSRGVWKAPAGLEALVRNTTGVVDRGQLTERRHGILNKNAINVLRSFAGVGTVVFGSRTLVSANPAFQNNIYIPVRRMTLFIEQTLMQNLKWVVFEPNDEPLWLAIRTTIDNFMLSLFNQGALQGSKPSDAFQVKCDHTTTTPDDQTLGVVNIVVAFAPLKPAEFVVIKIAHLAGQTQA